MPKELCNKHKLTRDVNGSIRDYVFAFVCRTNCCNANTLNKLADLAPTCWDKKVCFFQTRVLHMDAKHGWSCEFIASKSCKGHRKWMMVFAKRIQKLTLYELSILCIAHVEHSQKQRDRNSRRDLVFATRWYFRGSLVALAKLSRASAKLQGVANSPSRVYEKSGCWRVAKIIHISVLHTTGGIGNPLR